MASLVYAPRALASLERIFRHYAATDVALGRQALRRIDQGVQILADHPLIGRRVDEGMRELVISYGRTGFVALYRFRPERNAVVILAVRHQREAGFGG